MEWRELTPDDVKEKLLEPVPQHIHKYEKGSLALLAGSEGMEGAAALCALAAMRTGVGFVRALHGEDLTGAFQVLLPLEVVKTRVSFHDTTKQHAHTLSFLNAAGACLLGPGLGRDSLAGRALCEVVPKITVPTLMDADALNVFAERPFSLPKDTVFTPHHQEMARLLGEKKITLGKELFARVQSYVERHRVSMVLKGPETFIFSPGQTLLKSSFGNSGMATAGCGDVLSGVIASFLAQGFSIQDASRCGVYLHARAGEDAAKEWGPHGMMAHDLIPHLAFLRRMT